VPSIPNVLADRHAARQEECRHALRAVVDAWRAAAEAGAPLTPAELEARLPAERLQPYTYVFGDSEAVPPTRKVPDAAELARQTGLVRRHLSPGVRDAQLTVACVANFDGDPQLDVLSLSTAERFSWGKYRVAPLEVSEDADDHLDDELHDVTFALVK
jgi:hypothetical protein